MFTLGIRPGVHVPYSTRGLASRLRSAMSIACPSYYMYTPSIVYIRAPDV